MDDFFNNNNDKEKAKEVESTPINEPEVKKEYNNLQNSNQYYTSPQKNNNDYSANPYQQQYQQKYNNYYTPPVYSQNSMHGNDSSRTVINGIPTGEAKTKKKKNKAIIVLLIIFIVCIAVAAVGIFTSSNLKFSSSRKSNDSSVSQSDNNNGDSSGSGAASVEKSGSAAKTDKDGNLTAAGVAEKTLDSCVGITVYTQQDAYSYFYNYGYGSNNNNDNGESASGEGSGVIMSQSNGKSYIMTCAHVIADGTSFKVTLNNGDEYDAKMVGYDSQTDIGVLSIEKTGLSVAKFGDSEELELGEDCIAIGCPGGLEFMNSVTKGIVSALARPVSSSIGYNTECIQIDAAINPGNSGGALFNMQGQVIGINSSKIAQTDYEGMGFAVPSNTAVETANSLIKNGYVAGRAKLGIEYNSLENYNNASSILAALEQKGFKDAQGTMVIQNISDDSDLKNKKIQQYDMIVAANGKTLTSTDVMTSILSESKPGDTITLTIARVSGNNIKTFEVKCKLIESKQ